MEILLEKYHHANSLLKKGKIDKAVNIYLELLDKDFRKKEVLEKLVWLYFENYDFDNAEKYTKATLIGIVGEKDKKFGELDIV